MDAGIIGMIAVGGMLLLMAAGVPVAISMATSAFFGMWAIAGMDFALATFRTLPYSTTAQYTFVVAPMFILMGALATSAGITGELYTAAYRFLAKIRGSLYYATTLAATGFAAVSGSTVVAGAVFARIAMPEMVKYGYNVGIGAGCVAAVGTLAAMIPPSLSMVLYGILTGESIGALLMAGVFPGLLSACLYMLGIRTMLGVKPSYAPRTVDVFTWAQKLSSLKGIWALLLLVLIVLGGIYSGLVPPSSAGTVGAMGALLICLMRRRITGMGFWDALKEAAAITGVLFLIVIAGLLFTRMLLITGLVTDLSTFVQDAKLSPFWLMAAIVVVYLILGCFIDTVSMMVMTIPFVYPLIKTAGFDPVWFGVIMIKLVEIACITPPVGLNLYAVLSAMRGKVSTTQLFAGVTPFVLIEMCSLGLLLAYPQIALWLPSLMAK